MSKIMKWLDKRDEEKRKKDTERFTKWLFKLDRMYDELPDYIKDVFKWR